MKHIHFLLLFIVILHVENFSQGCCGIGGSLGTGAHQVLDKGTFVTNVSGDYTEALNPVRHRGGIDLLLAYGVTEWLSVSLATSHIWAQSSVYRAPIYIAGQLYSNGKTLVYKNDGVGDGTAAIQLSIIKLTPVNKRELVTGIDVGLPWGADRKMVNDIVLPGNVQTGSGGFALGSYVSYLQAFTSFHCTLSAMLSGTLRFKNRQGKDPGDEYGLVLTSLWGPFFNTRGFISFKYHEFGTTYNHLNKPENGTSGKRLGLIPGLEYSLSTNLKFSFDTEIPVWRDNNQKMYGNNISVKAGMFWFIRRPQSQPTIHL